MSMEKIFFEKEWILHFQRENLFGLFYLVFSNMRNFKEQIWGLIKYSINYCGRYIIISLGTKRLFETKIFEKKATVPVTKTLWPSFSPFIAHQKTQATFYTCSQGILIVFVWINRSFHCEVRCRWKQFFLRKKNATFQRKKLFSHFSLPLWSIKNLKY